MDDKARKVGSAPKRKRRRLWKYLAAFSLFAIVGVAALPWLLGTAPFRGWLVGKVNARLAPGSVVMEGLNLSWSGPIELSGVALHDPSGKKVLAARRVVFDRGVLGLLFSRPDYGTITIEGTTVDVERRADGSIDLLDALASILKTDPPPVGGSPAGTGPAPSESKTADSASIIVKGGTLRLVSPELVEPITTGGLEASATLAPGQPLELAATLADEGRSLEIRGKIGRPGPDDQNWTVIGNTWPIHVRQAGVDTRGRFDGALKASRERGLWTLKGDASLLGIEAGGPSLAGDRLMLDRATVTIDAGQSATGWLIRHFEMASPVASLSAGGSFPSNEGTPAQLRGRIDLAVLSRTIPHAMRLRNSLTIDKGTAILRADLTTRDGVERVEMAASLDDFAATEGGRPVVLREPVRMIGSALRSSERVAVEKIEVKAAGVDVTAGGDLNAGVKLSGSVDLSALIVQLRDILDLGVLDLSGHARLAADYRRVDESFKARFAADCKDLKIAGLTAEPIIRPLVRLDASAVGPRHPDGMPSGWHDARLDLKAGDLKVDVVATSADNVMAVLASAGIDVTSPVPGRAEAKASFRHKGGVFEVEELLAGITPAGPNTAAGAVALAVRGRLDLASGEAAFAPIPGSAIGAIGLAADGATLSGLGRIDMPLRANAALIGDLAALDRLLAAWHGSPLKGWNGAWTGRATIGRSATGVVNLDGKVDVADIAAMGLKGPVSLVLKGGYTPEADLLNLATLNLTTSFGRVVLDGHLAETKGRKLIYLNGAVEPNWTTVDRLMASSVEPDARFRAKVRTIRLEGSLRADSTPQLLGQLQGEVGLDLTMAQAFGVIVKPAPIVLKMGGGRAVFDPIVTAMNDGPVLIQANLAFDADYGLWLRLDPTRIEGAGINEAVSTSVLAYVAPVLNRSTAVNGKVTVAINRGAVPISAEGSMSLDGAIAFQDVVFKPGPLGAELTSITGRPAPSLKLNQAMQVQVADSRVHQSGLSIPISGNARVALEGSVGFDETLDLKATIPVSARLVGIDANLDQATRGATVAVPIRGTLSRPAIDRQALRVALRESAKGLAGKGLKDEAGRLLDRIAGPNPKTGEPKTKTGRSNPLGDLENLGREILDSKKP